MKLWAWAGGWEGQESERPGVRWPFAGESLELEPQGEGQGPDEATGVSALTKCVSVTWNFSV